MQIGNEDTKFHNLMNASNQNSLTGHARSVMNRSLNEEIEANKHLYTWFHTIKIMKLDSISNKAS